MSEPLGGVCVTWLFANGEAVTSGWDLDPYAIREAEAWLTARFGQPAYTNMATPEQSERAREWFERTVVLEAD